MPEEAQTFETFVTSERARIKKERDKVVAKKAELDQQLAGFDHELLAITAYENAKAGRTTSAGTRATRGPSTGGGRRTGQREAVLAIIAGHPDGIKPAQISSTCTPKATPTKPLSETRSAH